MCQLFIKDHDDDDDDDDWRTHVANELLHVGESSFQRGHFRAGSVVRVDEEDVRFNDDVGFVALEKFSEQRFWIVLDAAAVVNFTSQVRLRSHQQHLRRP